MNVEGIDERALGEQGYGCSFVVFIYEGGDSAGENFSWSVDSLLLTNTDLPQVLAWLREHLQSDAVGPWLSCTRPSVRPRPLMSTCPGSSATTS